MRKLLLLVFFPAFLPAKFTYLVGGQGKALLPHGKDDEHLPLC
jgi:hypothetical protein